MSYTVIHRDTGDGGYGQNSLQSEATPQPYSPEHERANAPPPPHCMLTVSVRRFFVFVSSMTIFFSRPHLPCTTPHSGMRPRCIRVFRTSVMARHCHMPTMWLAATIFGLTRSRLLRSLLRRRRRALPFSRALPKA